MIRVEHLTKRYGDRAAVRDVSFQVDEGEIVGFLGPNGAGKSTTLRMITGFLAPTEGSVQIGGIDALARPIEARRNLGYMPEGVPLYGEMRVHEYLRYRAELKAVPRRKIKEAVERALDQAAVADSADRIIGQLSKGYRQRVGLADALVSDPPLLILDEPTAGLDPNQIRQVRDLIRGFAGHKTVFVSTHILPEVEATCGRVVIIDKGRVVGEGRPDALRTAERGAQVVTVVGRGAAGMMRTVLEAVPGVRAVTEMTPVGQDDVVRGRIETDPSPEVAEAIFRAVAEADMVLRELHAEAASLEDVFTHLTTHELANEAEGDEEAGEEAEDAEDAEEAEAAASDEEGDEAASPEAEAASDADGGADEANGEADAGAEAASDEEETS